MAGVEELLIRAAPTIEEKPAQVRAAHVHKFSPLT